MNEKIDDLRKKAIALLTDSNIRETKSKWGEDIKKLLEELSIYHIELEQQNKELERMEDDLSSARLEYEELFNLAPVGYVVLDKSHKIIRVNKMFYELFIPVSEHNNSLYLRSFDDFISPVFQNTFTQFFKLLQKKVIAVPLEIKMIDKFSKPIYVILYGSAILKNERFLIAISDISIRKKMENQLVQAKELAEENERKKTMFLTNINHEIRTPLTTITGFGAMLRDHRLDDPTREEYIRSIVIASEMLNSLTRDMLDLGALEKGRMILHNSNVDFVKICEDTVLLFQFKTREKNILINLELDEFPILWADQSRVRQIIFNILDHAVNAATSGSIFITGRFVIQDSQNGTILLNISGNEIFSGENELEFSLSNHSGNGLAGMGIFMTKRIIELMNGKMIWEHPLNSLTIEIPMVISSKHRENEICDDIDPTNDGVKTCLLVDDVVMNLKVLDAIIRRLNYQTTLATSSFDALELLKNKHFDFILTDLWMPKMNGEELAMMIRQNPQYDNIPIYAITADIECEKKFNMGYFSDVIVKPINIEKLNGILNK